MDDGGTKLENEVFHDRMAWSNRELICNSSCVWIRVATDWS
jgi:hypothetical protein